MQIGVDHSVEFVWILSIGGLRHKPCDLVRLRFPAAATSRMGFLRTVGHRSALMGDDSTHFSTSGSLSAFAMDS